MKQPSTKPREVIHGKYWSVISQLCFQDGIERLEGSLLWRTATIPTLDQNFSTTQSTKPMKQSSKQPEDVGRWCTTYCKVIGMFVFCTRIEHFAWINAAKCCYQWELFSWETYLNYRGGQHWNMSNVQEVQWALPLWPSYEGSPLKKHCARLPVGKVTAAADRKPSRNIEERMAACGQKTAAAYEFLFSLLH